MAKQVFEFKDFSAGEYGRLEAWKAPKNSWTGTNMLVYRTGELGVRPGVRDVSPTGMSNGVVWGFGRTPNNPGNAWYGQGNAIKTFTANSSVGAISATTGTLTGTTSTRVAVDDAGPTQYIATIDQGCYSFSAGVVAAVTNAPNADAIALYGDRLIIVPHSANANLRYNGTTAGLSDFTVWPADNLIPVGGTDAIEAILTQRGHLSTLKGRSGLYVLTGVPGVNDALRMVTRTDGPTESWGPGRTSQREDIWFSTLNGQYLTKFDGALAMTNDNIPLPLYTGLQDTSVVPFRDDDQNGFAVVSNAYSGGGSPAQVWLYYRGAWSKHSFGSVAISDFAVAGFQGYPQDGDVTLSRVRYGTKLMFCDGGGASAHPKFYTLQPFMDRPGLEADPLSGSAERAGDDSSSAVSGNFTLPEQHTDDGTDLHVRGVIVDFRKWKTGASNSNHFDLTVNALRCYEAAGTSSSATKSFDEANATASLAGTLDRQYFSFGDQPAGGGFQLAFTNCRGVAFQRITVVAETSPARL